MGAQDLKHPMRLLREYEEFFDRHRPHCALDQAAPLRPLPDTMIDLDTFRVRRHDRAGGLLHEYREVAQVIGTLRSPTGTTTPGRMSEP